MEIIDILVKDRKTHRDTFIPAWARHVSYPFAVLGCEPGKYSITHLPTGRSLDEIGVFQKMHQAKAFVKRIKPFAAWEDITTDDMKRPEIIALSRKLRSVYRVMPH